MEHVDLPPPQSIADGAGLSSDYTPVGTAAARAILTTHFGIDGTLKRFASEKDDTFRVTCPDGRQFVLKIANPAESAAEIDFQSRLLDHIAMRDVSLPVPRVKRSLEHHHIVQVSDGPAEGRKARLLTFLEGEILADTRSDARERREIGRMLARLRKATEGFSHPAQDRVLAWDVQHLLSLDHLLSHVRDPARRRALEDGMKRFANVAPMVASLRRQVLHNDFSQSNLVVDHGAAEFVRGIIDFGDAVRTAIAIDVSTALLNQLPRSPQSDLLGAGHDVLTGYLDHADLSEEELRLLPTLVLARVVARALISLWRAEAFPGNATYILRNTEQGWHQLDWFLERSEDELSGLFIRKTRKSKD